MEGNDDLSARREAKTLNAPKPAGEPAIVMHMDDDRIVFRDEAALKNYVDAATVGVQNRVTELSSELSLLRDDIAMCEPCQDDDHVFHLPGRGCTLIQCSCPPTADTDGSDA